MTTTIMTKIIMRRIPVNVCSSLNDDDVKIWTADETLYALVNGSDNVQVTSTKAPLSALSILVKVYETEECCSTSAAKLKYSLGIINTNIDIMHIGIVMCLASSGCIKIIFEAT
jgi:hypothetical protein